MIANSAGYVEAHRDVLEALDLELGSITLKKWRLTLDLWRLKQDL